MLLFLSFPDNHTHILPHGVGPPLIIMGSTWISLSFGRGRDTLRLQMLVVRVSTLNRCYFIVIYSSAVWERWEVKSNALGAGFVDIFGVLGLDLDVVRVLASIMV